MSEFHAEAQIRVTADVSLFRQQLSDAVDAAKKQKLAVKITVDQKGFLSELRTAVDAASLKVKAKIRMEAIATGFQTDLRTKVSAAELGVTAEIGMVPDPTGFKALLQTAANTAAAGVTVPISPAAGGTAAGATRAAGGGGTSRALTLEQKLASAVEASAFARKKLSTDLTDQERRAERLVRQEAALSAARKVETEALRTQNQAVYEQAQVLRRAEEEKVASTKRAQTKAAAPALRAAEAEKAAQAEAKAAERAAEVQAKADAKTAEASQKAADKKAADDQKAAEKAAAAQIKADEKAAKESEKAAEKKAKAEAKASEAAAKERVKAEKAAADAEAKIRSDTAKAWEEHEKDRTAVTQKAATARGRFFAKEAADERKAAEQAAEKAPREVRTMEADVAARDKKASDDAAKATQKRISDQEKAEARRAKKHAQAIADDIAFDKKAANELVKSEARRIKSIESEILALQKRGAAARASHFSGIEAAARAEDKARTAAARSLTTAGAAVTAPAKQVAVETPLALARAEVAAATRAVTAAEAAWVAVQSTSSKQMTLSAAETLALAKTREFEARAAQKAILAELELAAATEAAAAKRAKSQAFATRGFGAQIASFAGLRAAVLAANPAFIAGTIAAIGFGKAVQSASAFESQLNVFGVTAGATADEMARVSETAKTLGADLTLPGVSAVDAAEGLAELSKAGLDVTDSINGIRGVLQLATAAQITNSQATELAASALNAFGLGGDQAVHVADALANASIAAQGSIEDMGIALQQSATVARQAGLSMDQTVAALTLFARAGLRGSDAGTSLRTMLLRIINPTAKAQRIINDLGLTIRDRFGRINLNFFSEFAAATENLTKRQRDQKLAVITGQDAIRAASILIRAGSKELEAMIKNTEKQGTAAEIAGARTKGFAGSVENLKNQLATTGSAIGTVLLPALSDVADGLSIAVQAVGGLVDVLGDLRKQADKPLDFVINVVRKVTGADELEPGQDPDAKQRFLKVIDPRTGPGDFLRNFFELGVEINAQIEAGIGLNTVEFPLLDQARAQIKAAVAEVNRSETPDLDLATFIKGLVEMEAKMSRGTKGTKDFAKSLKPFIEDLQRMSQGDFTVPIKFPKSLEPNAPAFEEAGRNASITTVEEFSRGFLPSMAEVGKQGAKALAEGMVDPGAKEAIAAAFLDIARATGREAGLEEEDDIMEAIGAPTPKRIANLKKRIAQQQKIVDAANRTAINGQVRGAALIKRRGARKKIAGFREEIRALEEKEAADEKKKQDEHDQNILDSLFQPARGLESQALIASGTKTLTDDIKIAKAQIANNKRRIAVISAGFKDRKKAAELIADIADENIKLAQGIADDQLGIVTAEREAFDVKLEQAGAGGLLEKQISLTRGRIADLNRIIASGKLEGEALKNYTDELLERNKQLEGFIDTQKQSQLALRQSIFELTNNPHPLLAFIDSEIKRITKIRDGFKKGTQLWRDAQADIDTFVTLRQSTTDRVSSIREEFAQSVLDLTGNKNPMLQYLNTKIKEARIIRNKAKKGTLDWVVAQTDVNELLARRKELLEDTEEKDGTTAFDLLKQYTEVFNESAGNLIGPDQPFISPSDFTSDISKFLVKRPGAGKGGITPRPGGKSKLELNDDKLTASLDRLNNTVAKAGGFSPSGGNGKRAPTGNQVNPVTTNIIRNDLRWSRQAREEVQG